MSSKILLASLFYFCALTTFAADPQSVTDQSLPSPGSRYEMVLKLKAEIDRVDGEGLIPRNNRPSDWNATVTRLAQEARDASTLFDLGRVFRRLDATYPNLHAKVYLIPALDERKSKGNVRLPLEFAPETIDSNQPAKSYRIRSVNHLKTLKPGDEIVSINSTPMLDWANENFNFCKFPLRAQCDLELFENFKNELLGWNRNQPLEIQVNRNGVLLSEALTATTYFPEDEVDATDTPCGVGPGRYEGFTVSYRGQNLCAFESRKHPGTVALRIKSFRYEVMPFAVLDGEVEIFWNNYWAKRSPSVKKLIIDVIDNWGGQAPIPYYGLFTKSPIKNNTCNSKRSPNLNDPTSLKVFSGAIKAKSSGLQISKRTKPFRTPKVGDFLPPIPQFCASSKRDCREGLFSPRKNGFKGRIEVLMNHWCISSCVGFVSNLKDLLKDRVSFVGLPDSGDSAYSRLSILVNPEGSSAKAQLAALKKAKTPDEPAAWVRQVVAVTRSTDKDGKILSGKPQEVDDFIPKKWNQSQEEWMATVFKKALNY